MDDLIKALQIFLKYGNPKWPTHCEHDVLYVCISPSAVSEDDIKVLDKLGFSPDYDDDDFKSYRFGSA